MSDCVAVLSGPYKTIVYAPKMDTTILSVCVCMWNNGL